MNVRYKSDVTHVADVARGQTCKFGGMICSPLSDLWDAHRVQCSAWRTCGPGLKKKQVQPQLKSPRLLNKLFLLWLATPKSWSWGEEGGDLNSCFFPTVWNDTILCCQLWPSHWDWVMNNNLHSALFFFFLLFAGYLPLSWESSECM